MSRKRAEISSTDTKIGQRSFDHQMFAPEQLRAARALVGWSQNEMASAANVAVMTVKNYERSLSDPRKSSMTSLKKALQKAGVEFISATDTTGAGVRWIAPRQGAGPRD